MSDFAAIVDRSERGLRCAWLLVIALASCSDVAHRADAGAVPAEAPRCVGAVAAVMLK